jgi:hypothetical protein
VSRDGAAFWRKTGLGGQTVFCLAFDATDTDVLYAGATDGLHRSQDGGGSWEPWGKDLQEITVSALAVDSTDGRTIYAGTKYHGFFLSDDRGLTWQAANEGLGSPSIDVLVVHPRDRLLYAGTPDGVYRGVVHCGTATRSEMGR